MSDRQIKDTIKQCDLFLIEGKESDIKKETLAQAKDSQTPILIKENDKFIIYGDKGNGSWTFTEITQGQDELQNLPFTINSINLVKRKDPKFTPSLINVLKYGHARIKEKEKYYNLDDYFMVDDENRQIAVQKKQESTEEYNLRLASQISGYYGRFAILYGLVTRFLKFNGIILSTIPLVTQVVDGVVTLWGVFLSAFGINPKEGKWSRSIQTVTGLVGIAFGVAFLVAPAAALALVISGLAIGVAKEIWSFSAMLISRSKGSWRKEINALRADEEEFYDLLDKESEVKGLNLGVDIIEKSRQFGSIARSLYKLQQEHPTLEEDIQNAENKKKGYSDQLALLKLNMKDLFEKRKTDSELTEDTFGLSEKAKEKIRKEIKALQHEMDQLIKNQKPGLSEHDKKEANEASLKLTNKINELQKCIDKQAFGPSKIQTESSNEKFEALKNKINSLENKIENLDAFINSKQTIAKDIQYYKDMLKEGDEDFFSKLTPNQKRLIELDKKIHQQQNDLRGRDGAIASAVTGFGITAVATTATVFLFTPLAPVGLAVLLGVAIYGFTKTFSPFDFIFRNVFKGAANLYNKIAKPETPVNGLEKYNNTKRYLNNKLNWYDKKFAPRKPMDAQEIYHNLDIFRKMKEAKAHQAVKTNKILESKVAALSTSKAKQNVFQRPRSSSLSAESEAKIFGRLASNQKVAAAQMAKKSHDHSTFDLEREAELKADINRQHSLSLVETVAPAGTKSANSATFTSESVTPVNNVSVMEGVSSSARVTANNTVVTSNSAVKVEEEDGEGEDKNLKKK